MDRPNVPRRPSVRGRARRYPHLQNSESLHHITNIKTEVEVHDLVNKMDGPYVPSRPSVRGRSRTMTRYPHLQNSEYKPNPPIVYSDDDIHTASESDEDCYPSSCCPACTLRLSKLKVCPNGIDSGASGSGPSTNHSATTTGRVIDDSVSATVRPDNFSTSPPTVTRSDHSIVTMETTAPASPPLARASKSNDAIVTGRSTVTVGTQTETGPPASDGWVAVKSTSSVSTQTSFELPEPSKPDDVIATEESAPTASISASPTGQFCKVATTDGDIINPVSQEVPDAGPDTIADEALVPEKVDEKPDLIRDIGGSEFG